MVRVFSFIFLILVSCNSTNNMRIATFFQPIKDSENLDVSTVITVPDQSLSVRDILMRFSRGQIVIPDIDSGDDDDIDSDISDFGDIVDAMDSIQSANKNVSDTIAKLKNKNLTQTIVPGEDDGVKQSETKEDSPE